MNYEAKCETYKHIKKVNEYLINFDYKIEAHIVGVNLMTVYYSSKDIKWALIDEELRTNHKDNIKEVEGFPKIISYEKK